MFNIFNSLKWLINGKTPDINTLTANDYYDRLRLIALSLFEWEGLPDSCNPRHLEQTLYMYGRVLFIEDSDLGFLNTKVTPSGSLNIYDEPISYTAYGVGYNKSYDKDDCVLIRNNYLDRPTDYSVMLFASRLTEAERTIDVNIKAQKTPILIRCDEKDRLTMKNLYSQFSGNEPFIMGSKSLNLEALKVLKTDAPYIADKVQVYKREVWNEALTFFGINNANSDKRERLITDEVNANNEVIDINAQAMLLTRLEACKAINKKYGLNVTVKMRSMQEDEEPTPEEKEVE